MLTNLFILGMLLFGRELIPFMENQYDKSEKRTGISID